MTSARKALRGGTLALHERVDALFSRWDLSRLEDYKDFLSAQAAAFLPCEQALDRAGADQLFSGWIERRRGGLLREDLLSCGLALPAPVAMPGFATPAAIWGGIYVLEGSRLGGALLARSVAPGFPSAFLGAAPQPAGWRKLLQHLEEHLVAPADVALAAAAAQQVFRLFEQAALRFTGGDEPRGGEAGPCPD